MTEVKLIKNTEDSTTEIETIEIEGYKINTYEVDYLERIKGLYGFIYVTTNLVNGKMYVGQKKIKGKHKNWKEYLGSGTVFRRAIEKHGVENFKRVIIDIAFNKQELDSLEKYYTYLFDVVDSPSWYNLCYGGRSNSGYKYTEEQRKALSERTSGKNNPMYGMSRELSPNYGKHHSEETKRKMREAALGEKNHNYGIKLSDEWRIKIKKAQYGIKKTGRKEVNQYDLKGRFIKHFISAAEASRETGVSHSHICAVCRNELTQAGGFIWTYGEPVEQIDVKELSRKYKQTVKIKQYNLDANLICIYDNAKEASRITGIDVSQIHQCCQGKQKQASGYLWAYFDDEITSKYINPNKKTINQYKDDMFIATWDSATGIFNALGIHETNIIACCRKRQKTSHGFKWFYADDLEQPDKTKIILKEE